MARPVRPGRRARPRPRRSGCPASRGPPGQRRASMSLMASVAPVAAWGGWYCWGACPGRHVRACSDRDGKSGTTEENRADIADTAVGAAPAGRRLRALAIRIAPRAADLAGDLAGRFLVLVRGAPDAERAIAALHQGRQALLDLATEHSVRPVLSGVVLSPDGPLFRVTDLTLGDEELHAVPGVVADALAEAGLERRHRRDRRARGTPRRPRRHPQRRGAAGVPDPGRRRRRRCRRAGSTSPPSGRWATPPRTERVAVRLLGAPFSVSTSDAARGPPRRQRGPHVVRPGVRRPARPSAVGLLDVRPRAAPGPRCGRTRLRHPRPAGPLRPAVRAGPRPARRRGVRLRGPRGHLRAGRLGLSAAGWRAHGGASPNAVAGQVVDEAVPDAFPYQVLGPGHRARRQQHGPVPLGDGVLGRPLEGGARRGGLRRPRRLASPLRDPRRRARAGVEGARRPPPHRPAARRAGRASRCRRSPPRGPELDAAAAPDHGLRSGPDLDDIVLDALPHPRRGLHVTLLELASWLGHEPHSDAPSTVSPVLAAYGRWLASGMDHARRQALKPYAAPPRGDTGAGSVGRRLAAAGRRRRCPGMDGRGRPGPPPRPGVVPRRRARAAGRPGSQGPAPEGPPARRAPRPAAGHGHRPPRRGGQRHAGDAAWE